MDNRSEQAMKVSMVSIAVNLLLSLGKLAAGLIARRIVSKLEGHEPSPEVLAEYANPESDRYLAMLEGIRAQMGFTSLRYNRLDDMLDAVGLDHCKMCTYCWNGRE